MFFDPSFELALETLRLDDGGRDEKHGRSARERLARQVPIGADALLCFCLEHKEVRAGSNVFARCRDGRSLGKLRRALKDGAHGERGEGGAVCRRMKERGIARRRDERVGKCLFRLGRTELLERESSILEVELLFARVLACKYDPRRRLAAQRCRNEDAFGKRFTREKGELIFERSTRDRHDADDVHSASV